MNIFTMNGREYVARKFDFNLICDLEDMGIAIEDMESKHLSVVRAYFKLCSGLSTDVAGEEIQQHIVNGGSMDSIMQSMAKEMEESDFFRAITENEKQTTSEKKEKATSKK